MLLRQVTQQLRQSASTLCASLRRPCHGFASSDAELPRYDRRSVDDLADQYDVEMYGEVPGDVPSGDQRRRVATGEARHHGRTAKQRRWQAPATGDYESFYHQRLPRVAQYELPHEVASDFLKFNTVVYPPQAAGEPRRPAEVCVEVGHVTVEPKALLLFGLAVSGLSVESALAKLALLAERDLRPQFKKLGHLAPLTISQAIRVAKKQMVLEEAVEFESDMWVESVSAVRHSTYTMLQKSNRWVLLSTKRPFSLLRVRLREGQPPAAYHPAFLPNAAAKGWPPSHEILQRERRSLRQQRIFREL